MLSILFATKIIEGMWTFEKVPNTWKEEVKQILTSEDREDLIV